MVGSFILAICDQCGLQGKHNQMVIEPETNCFVHTWCMDQEDPRRNYTPKLDDVSVPMARPDASVEVDTSDPDYIDPDEYFDDLEN